MSRNRSFSQREERTARTSVPAVPDLGRLTMPRKTNRVAAKIVASGDVLWDKRKVERKARKLALATQEARASRPGAHRLSRRQKQWVGNHLPAWSWNGSTGALQAPKQATRQQLDELVAVTRLPYVQRAALKIQGLCLEQLKYVAQCSPKTIVLIHVDPLMKSQQTVRVPRLG